MANTMANTTTIKDDITGLLKARNPLIWVMTREEFRAEATIFEAAGAAAYKAVFWDCAQGVTDRDGRPLEATAQSPDAAISWLLAQASRIVLVMRDVHNLFAPVTLRMLRNAAKSLKGSPREKNRTIVLLTPQTEVPPDLAGHATVLDFPIPTREEMARIFDDSMGALPDEIAAKQVSPSGVREAVIEAAIGLTAEEAENCFSRAIVSAMRWEDVLDADGKPVKIKSKGDDGEEIEKIQRIRRFVPLDPKAVAREKKRVIEREKVLSWVDPDPRGLGALGGLQLFKSWLLTRGQALTSEAREYGLPAPRGVVLVGVPGCGKSLAAKCVPTAWGIPLLRLDLGALKSKYVGESEANIRRALSVAETAAPCVLWIDEGEKGMGGANGPQGDGGVSLDALGTILSWMQEKTAPVFVVMTANDVSALPPELLRAGRFDAVFFVDLPTAVERAAILDCSLAERGRDRAGLDVDHIVEHTAGFSGAEVAALVPNALFRSFDDGRRALETRDIIDEIAATVPLSKTAADKIAAIREWATGRARPASAPEETHGRQVRRGLDLG